jgi:hypothetical protein
MWFRASGEIMPLAHPEHGFPIPNKSANHLLDVFRYHKAAPSYVNGLYR